MAEEIEAIQVSIFAGAANLDLRIAPRLAVQPRGQLTHNYKRRLCSLDRAN